MIPTGIEEKLNKLLESQEELLTLQKQNTEQLKTIADLNEKIASQAQTIAEQAETIAYLKKVIFGSKSEKSKNFNIPGQLSLFGDETPEDVEIEKEISSYKRKEPRKNKSTNEEIYKNLPSEKRLIPVSPEDRICPNCKGEMEHLGEKFVRDEIEIIPAQIKHIKVYQETVICRHCNGENDESSVIVSAKVPEGLIKGSPATPSIVAFITYMKYVNAVPLYRQEKSFLQDGSKIPRATMSNWIITCADKYFRPVYERLHHYLMDRILICMDETPCQVLKEKGKTPQSKSYMWLYCTGNDGLPPIAMYEYQPSRHGEHAKEFLREFKGKYAVCDGYQGYNKLSEKITRCGCLAHVRRKWADAIPAARKKAGPNGTAIPAEIGFDFCNQLFEKERELSGTDDPERRKQIREKEEPDIWEKFWKWLDTIHASDGSRLGKAVNYTQNQKPYLMNYLLDERIPISNNFAENSARPYAVGRKNFLFHNSTDGAETSAIIYSLVESAKRNKLNVMKYLETVLIEMMGKTDESEDIDDLMPWTDKIKKACSIDQENESEK